MTKYHATFSQALAAFIESEGIDHWKLSAESKKIEKGAKKGEPYKRWLYNYMYNAKTGRSIRTPNESTIAEIDEALHTVTSHVPGQGWSITKNSIGNESKK